MKATKMYALGGVAALALFTPMFPSCGPGDPQNCQNHEVREAVDDTWAGITTANIDWGVDPACWYGDGSHGAWQDVWSYQPAGPFQTVTCYGNHSPSYADGQHKSVNWSLGPGVHTPLGTVCLPGATQGGCISYITTPPGDQYSPSYDRVGCSILNDMGDFYLSYQGNSTVKRVGHTSLPPWVRAAIAKMPKDQQAAETAKMLAAMHKAQADQHIQTVP